jgi:hypothetical protein
VTARGPARRDDGRRRPPGRRSSRVLPAAARRPVRIAFRKGRETAPDGADRAPPHRTASERARAGARRGIPRRPPAAEGTSSTAGGTTNPSAATTRHAECVGRNAGGPAATLRRSEDSRRGRRSSAPTRRTAGALRGRVVVGRPTDGADEFASGARTPGGDAGAWRGADGGETDASRGGGRPRRARDPQPTRDARGSVHAATPSNRGRASLRSRATARPRPHARRGPTRPASAATARARVEDGWSRERDGEGGDGGRRTPRADHRGSVPP